jgi:hypothetical protein
MPPVWLHHAALVLAKGAQGRDTMFLGAVACARKEESTTMGRVVALLVRPRSGSVPLAVGGVAAVAALLAWLLANPAYNRTVAVPVHHFIVVTIVAWLALVVAGLAARAALQIEHYRALFLALGFMTMAGLFVVHGFSTPGIVVGIAIHTPAHGVPPQDVGGIIALSAFLSLFVPAVLFTLSYTPIAAPFEHRLPFRPAALLVGIVVALLAYAAVALGTPFLAQLPLRKPPYSYALASCTVALLLWCFWRQWRPYQATKVPALGALAVSYLFLALAQAGMVLGPLWTLAWWMYHLCMLTAVTLCLGTLLLEYGRGRPLRHIFEGALDLRVEVGTELESVETIAALAAATEAKDPYTRGHTVRVAELAVAIGRQMNASVDTLRVLARAGLLHDVGKLAIPDAVLLKPGPLTKEEWAIM